MLSAREPFPDSPRRLGDDLVLPFQIEGMAIRGRLVRLGGAIDRVLSAHAYPDVLSRLLGEALALTAMLGAALKFEGIFTLQAQGDGPVSLLLADYNTHGAQHGQLRGYASFDRTKLERLIEGRTLDHRAPVDALLGKGSLALTIDPRLGRERYQGIVPLEGARLSDCARQYFDQSEQIPTVVALAVAKHYIRTDSPAVAALQWRAGGLLLQSVATAGGQGGRSSPDSADDWRRAAMLAETVAADELVDPMLAPERLLFRLFHEDGVRVFDPFSIVFGCRCNRDRVEAVLAQYPRDTLAELAERGQISARCEFCNAEYRFTVDGLTADQS